jgi:hypothetical protein
MVESECDVAHIGLRDPASHRPATLTGFSDGLVVGSASIEVGTDPTQVKVDWNAIDQLAISYTGTPGFPVTDNFLFL